MPINDPPIESMTGVVRPAMQTFSIPDVDRPPRSGVLLEAESLINGERNIAYGKPTQNFDNIGEFFTTRLRHKLKDGERITAPDVADLMILLKLARSIANPKRDNYVDIAGYAGCGWECQDELNRQSVVDEPPF